jgi:hypothetical protein
MPPQAPIPSIAPPQIPPAALVQQKQGTAIMIWAIGGFVISLSLDPILVNKAYIASAYLVGSGSCVYPKSIIGSGRNLWMYASSLILHHTRCFLELIYWYLRIQASYILVCRLSWTFPLYSDGLGYHTFQLTDTLGYSSKFIWLSCICVWYSELLCFRLSFVMTLQANVWSHNACSRKGENIYDSQCDI